MNNDSAQRRLGKAMLWIFWLMAIAGLVVFFGQWEKRQYNPNQKITGAENAQIKTITLKRNRFGHYVASGSINEKNTVFMLDTGATMVAVPEGLSAQLGLHRGQVISVMTANGVAKAYQTEIKQLKLGAIELTDVRAAISPGMTGEEVLLGMSALKQLDFSQSGDELTLTQYTN